MTALVIPRLPVTRKDLHPEILKILREYPRGLYANSTLIDELLAKMCDIF